MENGVGKFETHGALIIRIKISAKQQKKKKSISWKSYGITRRTALSSKKMRCASAYKLWLRHHLKKHLPRFFSVIQLIILALYIYLPCVYSFLSYTVFF